MDGLYPKLKEIIHPFAKEFFYFTGQRDYVTCAMCEVVFGDFNDEDYYDLLHLLRKAHKECSPKCPRYLQDEELTYRVSDVKPNEEWLRIKRLREKAEREEKEEAKETMV